MVLYPFQSEIFVENRNFLYTPLPHWDEVANILRFFTTMA